MLIHRCILLDFLCEVPYPLRQILSGRRTPRASCRLLINCSNIITDKPSYYSKIRLTFAIKPVKFGVIYWP